MPAIIPPSDEGCKITSCPDWECQSKRYVYNLHVPPVPGTWYPTVHSNCLCNEMRSLVSRVLGETPPLTKVDSLEEAYNLCKPYFVSRNVEPLKLDDIPKLYRTGKRKTYERAVKSIYNEGAATSRDAKLYTFVKADKFNPLSKWADPRAIQARGRVPRYGVELMTFLKPAEHSLYSLKSLRFQNVSRSRLFAKGMNLRERARTIERKMRNVDDCVVIGLDMSRFDKHVKPEHLLLEHKTYLTMCGNDPRLRQLLSWQINSKGMTTRGIKYSLHGKRCSGDPNTAIGNCIIMLYMIVGLMKVELNIPQWDTFIDGDDTLLFVPGKYVDEVITRGKEIFLSYGHKVVFEDPVTELEDVEHCQCKPVLINGVYKMVRNPMKVLSHLASSYKHYHDVGGLRILKSTAMGELILSSGVPIVQSYALRIIEALESVKVSQWVDEDLWIRLVMEGKTIADAVPTEIRPETRASFDKAFGLDATTQLAYEAICSRVTFEDINITRMELRDVMWDEQGNSSDYLPYSLF